MGAKVGDWFVAVHQDVGRAREHQEDFATAIAEGSDLLLLVCDGMGGHAAGDVASARAGSIVEQHFRAACRDHDEDIPQSLWSALVEANDVICRDAQMPDKKGMGTTAVLGWLRGPEVWVAHVGDSRLLHLREGATSFRTKDHTRVQKMVDAGVLTPEEAAKHADANVVQRALGHMPLGGVDPEKRPEVRSEPLTVKRGDAILLCSDGLFDLVSDAEVASALIRRSAKEAAGVLVDLANERGGTDNISVVIAIYGSEQASWTVLPVAAASEPSNKSAPSPERAFVPAVAAAQADSKPHRPAELPWKWIALGATAIAVLALVALAVALLRSPVPPPAPQGKHPAAQAKKPPAQSQPALGGAAAPSPAATTAAAEVPGLPIAGGVPAKTSAGGASGSTSANQAVVSAPAQTVVVAPAAAAVMAKPSVQTKATPGQLAPKASSHLSPKKQAAASGARK